MKYFAEYLLDLGILTEDKLMEVVIDQVENSPSTLRLVCQTRLLTTQQIFQALKFQSEKNVEFKNACEALGFWSMDLEIAVRAEFNKRRQPFGVSLLSNGHLNLEQLTKHFDEYFSIQAKEFAASTTTSVGLAAPRIEKAS